MQIYTYKSTGYCKKKKKEEEEEKKRNMNISRWALDISSS
jgi:hypothetical protein